MPSQHCRKCNAKIIPNFEIGVSTPTCPHCGAWYPTGGRLYWLSFVVVAAVVVLFALAR